MFEILSSRLQGIFTTLRGEVRLTEKLVESALREIRMALLEADVNFKVVKALTSRIRDRALDQKVLQSLTPTQHVIRIVRDEMLALFGETAGGLSPASKSLKVVLMLGLQGCGKTTTTAKLGSWLVRQGRHPILVSTDVRRPAAIQQLSILGSQAGLKVHDPIELMDPVKRAVSAIDSAHTLGFDTLLVDSAGSLHVNDALMTELEEIKKAIVPTDSLYVVDAMTGQDAIKSASEFNRRLDVSGVVLTKMDGDARGGAALSVVSVVGVPVMFVGTGERLGDLELFHPDRVVSRMLGMGDVLTLIEKAEEAVEKDSALRLEERILKDQFTLQDFSDQLQAIKKLGSLNGILNMIPSVAKLKIPAEKLDEQKLVRIQAIISSMTTKERQYHKLINGSRRKRIAKGSGTSVEEVNQLLRQFLQMRKMMKTVSGSLAGVSRGPRKGRKRYHIDLPAMGGIGLLGR